MSFWCSASSAPWDWSWRAYPGVWLFVIALGVGVWRWNARAARRAGQQPPPLHPLFVAGLLVLWLALDWPIGALGAGYLASVHMLQFLLIALVAPPLLLRGPSRTALAALERGGLPSRILERLTSPITAMIVFNAAVLLTHLPAVVDSLMTSQLGSFLIDVVWIAAGVLFWWPVVVGIPHRPRFVPPLRIGYLVLGLMFSPIMFGLVAFLVYSQTPLYGVFELAPPIAGISSHDDHQTAGVLMSVGGGVIAFIGISVIFFRWAKESA